MVRVLCFALVTFVLSWSLMSCFLMLMLSIALAILSFVVVFVYLLVLFVDVLVLRRVFSVLFAGVRVSLLSEERPPKLSIKHIGLVFVFVVLVVSLCVVVVSCSFLWL